MKKQETLEAFYSSRGITGKAVGLFNVFANNGLCTEPHVYNRRDYYKISLLLGKSRLSWHHYDIEINRPALVLYNPRTPFAWLPLSDRQPGYFCLFKEAFLTGYQRNEGLKDSPLFKTGSNPVFFLDKPQQAYIGDIFRKMKVAIESDYRYRYDLLRNYLQLLIHEALMMEPHTIGVKQGNAAERVAARFLELLERQFPIDAPERALQLKTAGDYAKALSVHVNHLNAAVKKVTGKPTSAHIADRMLAEAKALLKHTDWPVAEIAYSLGFEYPNYFYNFFKKKTGYSPKQIRAAVL